MKFIDYIEDEKTIKYWGEEVLKKVGMTHKELVSQRRTRAIANKRTIVYYFLRVICKYSLHEVAIYCNRDHSTVVQMLRRRRADLLSVHRVLEELKGAQ